MYISRASSCSYVSSSAKNIFTAIFFYMVALLFAIISPDDLVRAKSLYKCSSLSIYAIGLSHQTTSTILLPIYYIACYE